MSRLTAKSVELALLLALAGTAAGKDPVYLLHRIGSDRSEGVAVFDFDRDGKLDVTSGAYWYKAPDWTRTEFRECPPFLETVKNCGEYAIDVNKDGYPDIVTASPQEDGIFYFENPRKVGVPWKKVTVASSKQTEGMLIVDIDGDGMVDLLPSHFGKNDVFWVEIKNGAFRKRPVGPDGGHGVGFGDLDGDGKPDIVTPSGWYRQVDISKDQWEWRPEFKFGMASIDIVVLDLNGDGLNDLIYGKAHDYGLRWVEQGRDANGKRIWTEHSIDDWYSQIHTVKLVDLDGDGEPELLAGKRYRPHGNGDPGAFDPLAMFYYKIRRGKEPAFTPRPIAYNAIAGTGMQFVVVDLDGDGDLDIVVGGKSGQYWFENLTINKVPMEKRSLLFNEYPAR